MLWSLDRGRRNLRRLWVPSMSDSARAQPTPHVCQFCDTPLADHWWDPCTYTPPAPDPVTLERVAKRAAVQALRDAADRLNLCHSEAAETIHHWLHARADDLDLR